MALGGPDASLHCCHCRGFLPLLILPLLLLLLLLRTGAKAGRQQLLAIAGLACSRFSPRTMHLCFGVSWGRLSRKGRFQRREKQDEVGWGAPDHSLSELSRTIVFATTHYRAPSK
eukprot:1157375-Pelagomonas_calceolata.AAC.16